MVSNELVNIRNKMDGHGILIHFARRFVQVQFITDDSSERSKVGGHFKSRSDEARSTVKGCISYAAYDLTVYLLSGSYVSLTVHFRLVKFK